MLGFHRRTRSLIPVKDLAKYDKLETSVHEEEMAAEESDLEAASVGDDTSTADVQRKLTLVYVLFLAEAIMASSLQGQLRMLIDTDDFCGTLSTSYLRGLLDCAYALGGVAGIFWGWLADRVGRRPVALLGLAGMLVCCVSMGFATELVGCTAFRFVAGLCSSAVTVTVLTMIGDLSVTPGDRARNIARLPLISSCGSVGPIIQGLVGGSLAANGAIWSQFPTLSSQIVCASLVFVITLAGFAMLTETLPQEPNFCASSDPDCEKAAFLGRGFRDDPAAPLSPCVVDYVRPDPISLAQFLQAPSLLVLLSSFSLLSLHASTFDVILPHLGHSSTQQGGMGISCTWLGVVVVIVRALAGLAVLQTIPHAVSARGLLQPYRVCSLLFPAVYIVTPVLGYAVAWSTTLTTAISTAAILVKHALAGSAQVLVVLLMLNATPDAFSAGSVVGLMQVASLWKGLAVAISGASYYLSSDVSVATTNLALWTTLAVCSGVGAGLAWFVRDRPRVEQDFPSEVLTWETCFDAEHAW